MKRLDLALVEQGLAPTRSKAQQLIDAGDVEVCRGGEWQVVRQASFSVRDPIRIREESEILKYVSRGGLKLEGALEHLQLDVRGWRCLDLGLSTGGFADCLLQAGAAEVCGVDVGHGQLHPRLSVLSFEGVNVKDVATHPGVQQWLAGGVNLCVADLSFISLISLLPVMRGILPAETLFLGLVKPQFEVGAVHLSKAGVVKDPALYVELARQTEAAVRAADFEFREFFPSRLKGQDGNQEFFVYAK